ELRAPRTRRTRRSGRSRTAAGRWMSRQAQRRGPRAPRLLPDVADPGRAGPARRRRGCAAPSRRWRFGRRCPRSRCGRCRPRHSVERGGSLSLEPFTRDLDFEAPEAAGAPDALAALARQVLVVEREVELHGEGAALEAGHRRLHEDIARSNSGKYLLISASSKLFRISWAGSRSRRNSKARRTSASGSWAPLPQRAISSCSTRTRCRLARSVPGSISTSHSQPDLVGALSMLISAIWLRSYPPSTRPATISAVIGASRIPLRLCPVAM